MGHLDMASPTVSIGTGKPTSGSADWLVGLRVRSTVSIGSVGWLVGWLVSSTISIKTGWLVRWLVDYSLRPNKNYARTKKHENAGCKTKCFDLDVELFRP